jgi:GAF domain-containing protein
MIRLALTGDVAGGTTPQEPREPTRLRATGGQMFREQRLSQAFVELADTLVDDFDVVDFMTLLTERCVELLGATDGGLMLVDAFGELRVVASSSEQMRTLELLELQASEGPCLDAFRTGAPAGADDLDDIMRLWPNFGVHVRLAGYHSIYAVPMRLRSTIIGALNLFSTEEAASADDDLEIAQALADVATIGLLHHRAMDDAHLLSTQLQSALSSRVTIEQAKGLLAERLGTNTDEAFQRLRRYARSNNLLLAGLATSLLVGTLSDEAMNELAAVGDR